MSGRAAPLFNAFADNVRGLIASAEFRQNFVERPAKLENAILLAPKQPLIQLPGAVTTEPVGVADAISSVVLIFAGDGHGSGFLVSTDGYVMTDQHVIGAAKHVRGGGVVLKYNMFPSESRIHLRSSSRNSALSWLPIPILHFVRQIRIIRKHIIHMLLIYAGFHHQPVA